MNLFRNDEDRQLWIKLNAERQIEWEKSLTWFNSKTGNHEPTLQAKNPRSIEEALEVSKRQLEYDEKIGKLRYTLEELLLLKNEELVEINKTKHKAWFEKITLLQ